MISAQCDREIGFLGGDWWFWPISATEWWFQPSAVWGMTGHLVLMQDLCSLLESLVCMKLYKRWFFVMPVLFCQISGHQSVGDGQWSLDIERRLSSRAHRLYFRISHLYRFPHPRSKPHQIRRRHINRGREAPHQSLWTCPGAVQQQSRGTTPFVTGQGTVLIP